MRRIVSLVVSLIISGYLVSIATAQERMRIAWAGSTPSNTPIWVADQKGFFKKNGLNAEVISISASTIVIQALLTGEVDFIIAPSATLVTSRLAGADTVMVSTNLPLFIDHIVSLGSITTIEQLKGKIGGVNRLGTTSDMTLRLALRRLGVDPEKETKIIATGENPQRLAALANNITQFTLLGEPLVREAEKTRLPRPVRHRHVEDSLPCQRHRHPGKDRQRAPPAGAKSRARLHRSAALH